MQHRLYGLRGKSYTAKYKQLHQELISTIAQEFRLTVERSGKFTPLDLGELAIKFQLPVKVMAEFLEGDRLIPTGTWSRLQDRGCRAKDIGVKWE